MGDAASWIVVVGVFADSAKVDLGRPGALPAFDTTLGAHGPLELVYFEFFTLMIKKHVFVVVYFTCSFCSNNNFYCAEYRLIHI